MKVNVQVINIPVSMADWKLARQAASKELPALTLEQKSFARDFGISEEEYARDVLGRKYAEARYRRYAEHFASLLLRAARARSVQSAEIIFDVWEKKFHCWLKQNGSVVPVSFAAGIITLPLEHGDSEGLRQARKAVQFGVEQALSVASKTNGPGVLKKRR